LAKTSQIFENHSVSFNPIRRRDTLKMAPMITAGLTRRGKPNYRDKNNFYYVFNGERAETKNWRCSQRSCTATLTTRISTGILVGDVLPTHGHTNKLLKTKAKTTEKAVIEKYANVQGKQRSKDSRQRVKFVVEAFHTMPKADYIQTLAHDQQKINNDK